MYIDKQTLLAGTQNADNTISAQTVTGASAVVSDNAIDLRVKRDAGKGTALYGAFQVATAAAGGTAMEFQIIAADDAALSSNVQVVGSTGAVPLAQLTAGARVACRLGPSIGNTGQRYLGARFVPTGTMSAGAYIGALTVGIQDGQTFYPAGYAVI